MPTLANKRNEYLDKTYDEDLKPLGPVEEQEEYTGPPFVGTADRVGALVEPEEYQDNAPFKEVEGYSYTGGSVHPSDPLQRTTFINDQSEGGSNSYGIGEHIKGLGTVEGIDKHGNATILPKSGPKFRLGRSEGRSEGKAEEPEEEIAAGKFHDDEEIGLGELISWMLPSPAWMKPGGSYQGEEPDEEEEGEEEGEPLSSILEPEEEHQYMLDYIYPGLTDKQVDQAVWEDYKTSTPIDGTLSYDEDGTWIQQSTRPDGETITLVGYGEGEGKTPRANVTGATR